MGKGGLKVDVLHREFLLYGELMMGHREGNFIMR